MARQIILVLHGDADAHQLGKNNKDVNIITDRSTGICAKEERACHGHCSGVARVVRGGGGGGFNSNGDSPQSYNDVRSTAYYFETIK